MASLDRRSDAPRGRFILEKVGHQVQLLIHKAEPIEDHRRDRLACGHETHFWVLLDRFINDFSNAECVQHARDKAQVISDLGAVRRWLRRDVRAVRVSHSLLLCRGIVSAPKNYSMTRE